MSTFRSKIHNTIHVQLYIIVSNRNTFKTHENVYKLLTHREDFLILCKYILFIHNSRYK